MAPFVSHFDKIWLNMKEKEHETQKIRSMNGMGTQGSAIFSMGIFLLHLILNLTRLD